MFHICKKMIDVTLSNTSRSEHTHTWITTPLSLRQINGDNVSYMKHVKIDFVDLIQTIQFVSCVCVFVVVGVGHLTEPIHMINSTKIELKLHRLLFICSSLQTHPMYAKYETQLIRFWISSGLQHVQILNVDQESIFHHVLLVCVLLSYFDIRQLC